MSKHRVIESEEYILKWTIIYCMVTLELELAIGYIGLAICCRLKGHFNGVEIPMTIYFQMVFKWEDNNHLIWNDNLNKQEPA